MMASEEELRGFQPAPTQPSLVEGSNQKMKAKRREKDYYIPHVPSDFHSEKGLSVVGSSFDRQAALVSLDLEGDEAEGGRMQRQQLKWCV